MPDATYGIVNSVSYSDLKKVGTEAIVTNTLHVSMNADDKHVNDLGGFKSFTGWEGGVITDSGGFQAYSLVKRGLGKMFDDRVEFQQRTQFYSGKIKKASKYVNKNAPIRYEQHLKDFEFPIGEYEPEIIEDKLIIYKES